MSRGGREGRDERRREGRDGRRREGRDRRREGVMKEGIAFEEEENSVRDDCKRQADVIVGEGGGGRGREEKDGRRRESGMKGEIAFGKERTV